MDRRRAPKCKALAVAALAVAAGACAPGARTETTAPPTVTTAAPTTNSTTTVPPFTDYQVASIHAAVAGYNRPGGSVVTTVQPTWYGVASNLAVVAVSGSWIEVRLATRPNQSTAWVQRDSHVTMSQSPYRIVVDLATRHLELYKSDRAVLDAPAGIGTPDDPTPTGHYFVAFLTAPPSPGYGPVVLVTSAHSDAITDWEGLGDALIAIHGPLGDDAGIGTAGGAISHGCIRLHAADLARLAQVPAGSPVDIVG